MLPERCAECGEMIEPGKHARVRISIQTYTPAPQIDPPGDQLIALQEDHYHEHCARPKPRGNQ